MSFDTADMFKFAGLAASGAILVGSFYRDHQNDKRNERIERTVRNIEREMDYVAERAREEDPEMPWYGDEDEEDE